MSLKHYLSPLSRLAYVACLTLSTNLYATDDVLNDYPKNSATVSAFQIMQDTLQTNSLGDIANFERQYWVTRAQLLKDSTGIFATFDLSELGQQELKNLISAFEPFYSKIREAKPDVRDIPTQSLYSTLNQAFYAESSLCPKTPMGLIEKVYLRGIYSILMRSIAVIDRDILNRECETYIKEVNSASTTLKQVAFERDDLKDQLSSMKKSFEAQKLCTNTAQEEIDRLIAENTDLKARLASQESTTSS